MKVDVSKIGGPLAELMSQLMGPNGAERLDEFNLWLKKVTRSVIRCVRVNRSQTPAQAIAATGRHRWPSDEEILAEMPIEGREEDTVEFFELDYDPAFEELDREYESRGLRPDPLATAQAMADDSTFADERPVGVQWRDKDNRACCAIFSRFDGKRGVFIGRDDVRWRRFYRFAGVRK